MIGNCPACSSPVTRLNIKSLSGTEGISDKGWKALTLNCPTCHAVLGAQFDPLAMKADTVNETVREVKKALGQYVTPRG